MTSGTEASGCPLCQSQVGNAGHRLDRAKYLAKASMAMLDEQATGKPSEYVPRTALSNWVFNKTHRESESPPRPKSIRLWSGCGITPCR